MGLFKKLTKSKNPDSKKFRREMAYAVCGQHIKYVTEKRDDVDEVMQLPAEKDLTDTQVAVETAIERGADEIIIVGSTSGRFDHALSTLAILEKYHEKHLPIYIVNGQNRVRYIKNSGFIVIRSQYKYFSIIAADAKVKGVSIEGAKYPLINKTLTRDHQFAVSNEIEKNAALINVKKGGIFIIESRDL